MKISKQARRDAKALFNSCRVEGVLDESRVRQTVQLVLAQKPRGYLAIASHFARLVKLDVARRAAQVDSAAPLPAALQESLKENLSRKYGAGLNISFAEDPVLIGGLRVRVGSDVYDGSVQARLNALAESF
jgi:F-type H+-transporting ATPase subunit delta